MSLEPLVIKTDAIPTEAIDPDALKVIRRLRRHKFDAYLVGGCVRDLMVGFRPKDFDVITSARPRQVRRLFSNSRVIGRRFRLVHVIFGDKVIEVSTFRADPTAFEDEDAAEEAVAETSDDTATTPIGETSDDEALPLLRVTSDDDVSPVSPDDVDTEDPDADDDDDSDEDDDDDLDEEDVIEEDVVETSDDELPAPGDRGPTASGREASVSARLTEFELNNIFGTPEQDARRRDFTINSLFYDPESREIIDYVGGIDGLHDRVLVPNRNPWISFREDPARMIRALRFASRLGFEIEAETRRAMYGLRGLIASCSQRRLLEEIFKILASGSAAPFMKLAIETGINDAFLPEVAAFLRKEADPEAFAASREDATDIPETIPDWEPPSPKPRTEITIEPRNPFVAEVLPADQNPLLSHLVERDAPSEPPRWGLDQRPARLASFLESGLVPDPVPTRPGFQGVPITEVPQLFELAFRPEENPEEDVLEDLTEASGFGRSAGLRLLGDEPAVALAARERAMRVHEGNEDGELETAEDAAAVEPVEHGETVVDGVRLPPAPEVEAVEGHDAERVAVLMCYMNGLDRLVLASVPVTTAFQLSILYAPVLRASLEAAEAEGDRGSPELLVDDLMRPVAVRHSLARRDRDRVKRLVLAMRRLRRSGTGAAASRRRRSRGRGQGRLLGRDYFEEALYLLGIDLRATGEGARELLYWTRRAESERGLGVRDVLQRVLAVNLRAAAEKAERDDPRPAGADVEDDLADSDAELASDDDDDGDEGETESESGPRPSRRRRRGRRGGRGRSASSRGARADAGSARPAPGGGEREDEGEPDLDPDLIVSDDLASDDGVRVAVDADGGEPETEERDDDGAAPARKPAARRRGGGRRARSERAAAKKPAPDASANGAEGDEEADGGAEAAARPRSRSRSRPRSGARRKRATKSEGES